MILSLNKLHPTFLLKADSQCLEWDWGGRGGVWDGRWLLPLGLELCASCEGTLCGLGPGCPGQSSPCLLIPPT